MPLKIYQRGKTYHYRGTVAGRRLRGSTGAANKETAARIAAEIEAREWKRGTDGPQAVLTFADAAVLYRGAGKSTRFLERIEDYWKDTLVKEINAGAIRQSALTLYPKAANATRNRQVIVPTQAIINHAAEAELCSPVRVKRFKVEAKIKDPATEEWVRAFVKHANPHIGGACLFMYATGCRISEALAVRWKDIDLKARTALIRQTKQSNERKAHLPPELVVHLANMPRFKDRNPFLYVAPTSAQNAWNKAIRLAGIKRLTPHSCRHGFATGLLKANVDVVTVSKLGGWKTPKHVFQTYGHATDDPTLTERLFGTNLTQADSGPARKARK